MEANTADRTGAAQLDLRLMARSLSGLFLAGATIALTTVLLPHTSEASELGQLLVIGNAYIVGVVLFFFPERAKAWELEAALAAGTLHITLVAAFSDERPSPLLFFYLWIFLHSAYFSSRRVVIAQILFVGANLAVLLGLREPSAGAEAWWLVTMGSMLVAAALVTAMRDRADRLIASLHATARDRERAQRELAAHRDNLELEVEERTAALQVAYKELESFSYSVSHDLRAPLRSLDGFSQAISEDYADVLDEQGHDYLQRIRAASGRMAQLIDDMLQLSRLSRSEMRRRPIDLSALAEDVVAELREGDPEREVEVRIEPGLETEADERLIRAALQNLIGNAWKFTSRHERATIEVGSTDSGTEPTYFVRDDGAGFDMEYADRLFGAFQRLHTSSEFEGTGIGLATVQRIIHRHGGKIWAEAEPDQGATFSFTLGVTTNRKDGDGSPDPAGRGQPR